MREDADRWNARYAGRIARYAECPQGRSTGFDGVEPARRPERVPRHRLWHRRAVDLGGPPTGSTSLPSTCRRSAIDALRRAAGRRGLEHRIDARVVDLDDGLPADVRGLCSLVVCQRFRDPRLYPAIADAARPGGLIVVTVLSAVGLSTAPVRSTLHPANWSWRSVRSTSTSCARSRVTAKRRSSLAAASRRRRTGRGGCGGPCSRPW